MCVWNVITDAADDLRDGGASAHQRNPRHNWSLSLIQLASHNKRPLLVQYLAVSQGHNCIIFRKDKRQQQQRLPSRNSVLHLDLNGLSVQEQKRLGGGETNHKNSIKAGRLYENFYLIMRIRWETGEDRGHDPRTFNQPCFIWFPPTRDNPTRLFPPEFL